MIADDVATAELIIQAHDEGSRHHRLHASPAILGSSPAADVFLPGLFVSRNHARFDFSAGAWTITDMGSKNGTRVNGVRLTPGQPTALADRDRTTVPGYVLTFWCPDPLAVTRELGTLSASGTAACAIRVDEAARRVWVDGQPLAGTLSPTEFSLLLELSAAGGQVCTRARLVAALWGQYADGSPKGDDNMLYGVVHALRRRDAALGRAIVNVRSVGYALSAPRGRD
jgi:hypothetical protein